MTAVDPLADLASRVRARRQQALRDKALFERDQQRLNSQLMQGEINLATAVLGWIDALAAGAAPVDADEPEADEG